MNPNELIRDPAAVLALAEMVSPSLNGSSSFRLASWLEAVDTADDIESVPELSGVTEQAQGLAAERVTHWARLLSEHEARLVTVADDEYPANLRMVHDRPPFLFVRGTLVSGDERAFAVVGTRSPSEAGLAAASALGRELALRDITVVSGLAAGIDTSAHAAALNAGGRTLAVLGTGIDHVYPAANRSLARQITLSGALLSQFWPDMRGTRWSFPVRNIVTSGLSIGTVVVEAGPTSGARQQAEHALRHGKRLYLLRQLVEDQPWARSLIDGGAVAIEDPAQIVDAVEVELDLEADVLV